MQTAGWIVIIFLYATIGVLAAYGFISLARKFFSGTRERVFYGLFLILIALFYLSFAMYFEVSGAVWELEVHVILLIAALGLAGTVRTELLITGYLLHGLWDLVHELYQHFGLIIPHLDQLTPIPLAYGAFCFSFDLFSASYFYFRRKHW